MGSDFLVKKLHASRYWCLSIASVIFFVAQIFALNVQNPHYLGFVSGFTGLAYGFLFGCYPSLVAEAFGVHGLSQNWGCMTLAPVISGNIFNLFYGIVFDSHSNKLPSGERQCSDGLDCYRNSYWVTFSACSKSTLFSLFSIGANTGNSCGMVNHAVGHSPCSCQIEERESKGTRSKRGMNDEKAVF